MRSKTFFSLVAALVAVVTLVGFQVTTGAQGWAAIPEADVAEQSAPLPAQSPTVETTLLVYNTVDRLLAGDLLNTVTVDDVQVDLAAYPSHWAVVGVGTTDWAGRNGEMLPSGTAGDLRFWWADPDSPSHANVVDLSESLAHFPFMALAVGDPARSISWWLQDEEDVHRWLEQNLQASDIDLAGVQLEGQFGQVETSVAYYLPLTGLDLSSGYVGDDHFRFGDYVTATWTMNGVYAADPALQPVVSTAGHPLHLHGYQPDRMLGGHIKSARAISVTATIWPLTNVVTRTGQLSTRRLLDDLWVTVVDYAMRDSPVNVPTRAGVSVKSSAAARGDYRIAFRRAARATFADPAQFHDPHGLMALGLLRDQLAVEFGQTQVHAWLGYAFAEACVVEMEDGWAGAYVLQPDLPLLPSCGFQPHSHFTSELILAMSYNDLHQITRPGWGTDAEVTIPRADLVRWLQNNIAIDEWSPGMETQALIVGGVPLTETWQAADGETWSLRSTLEAAIERWREHRETADLQPGDIVPENMLHLAPALIDLFHHYPETVETYGPVLDEVLATYESALHPDGYWGFPGESFSTGHIMEQYVAAQAAGVNVALPSLHPVELMVAQQTLGGWFDIHNSNAIGAQSHGLRALGATLPLLEGQLGQ